MTKSRDGESNPKVDWEALAEKIGAVNRTEDGYSEYGGGSFSRNAIAELLGDEVLRSAVEHALVWRPGRETAARVLRLLRLPMPTAYCVEIFRAATDPEEARMAILALRDFVEKSVLEALPEILRHPDELVRIHGVRLIDSLWMSKEIEPEQGLPLLLPMLDDPSDAVVEHAEDILGMLRDDIARHRASDKSVH
ncbi:HEAT repeat domain-containing protein [Altererythrobacter sp. KTW20L]|uniref:HEAT repeat domain-containing protein n=1 Tax=Altererythrobacter sp. KTW20L TaxID=2942210 RepID=UPI0020BDEA7F|nr:HEAT repeat domain-containing protein [Altererythrobacter sp. KTW20L]